MSNAAYSVEISIAGTPTDMQHVLLNGSGRTWTVVGSIVLNPGNHQNEVFIGDVRVPSDQYTLSPNTLVFLDDDPLGDGTPITAVSISGKFSGTVRILSAESYTLNLSATLLDDTNFKSAKANGGHRTRVYGMLDASLTASEFFDPDNNMIDRLFDREPVFITINTANDGDIICGWFILESDNSSGDVSSLESEELSFQLDDRGRGLTNATFAWTKRRPT